MQNKLLVTSLIIAAASADFKLKPKASEIEYISTQGEWPAFNLYPSCEGSIAFFTQNATTG